MYKKINNFLAGASLLALSSIASAASVSVDVPVSVEITPVCDWVSATADSLTTAELNQPATAAVSLVAVCDAGVAYTIRSDQDSQGSTIGGTELVLISLYADVAHTSPLATGPGITGVAPNTGSSGGEEVNATVYVKATGQGAGGGFTSGGSIAQRSFNLTISY